MEEKKFNLIFGDCLTEMETLIEQGIKVDMILCDLPYGTTACAWDSVIPLDKLWSCYKQLITENGVIALFGSQPFTSTLVASNIEMYKYNFVWVKNRPTGMTHCKNMPMKDYEDIAIFSNGSIGHIGLVSNRMKYYPQGIKNCSKTNKHTSWGMEGTMERKSQKKEYTVSEENYPRMVLYFDKDDDIRHHPTQKPEDIMQYLIQTYTKENEIVMDNTMGSGTTGVSCMKIGRRFIGIEKERKYFDIAEKRISAEANQIKLF